MTALVRSPHTLVEATISMVPSPLLAASPLLADVAASPEPPVSPDEQAARNIMAAVAVAVKTPRRFVIIVNTMVMLKTVVN